MLHKHFNLFLFFTLVTVTVFAQPFKLGQPDIINNSNEWLEKKKNNQQKKYENAPISMDIFYPNVDFINDDATLLNYGRIHNDFLPGEYIDIFQEGDKVDTIFLKYRKAILNFLWMNDSFNEDSITYTFNSIAPITLDTIFFSYVHLNRSGETNYIKTSIVNVDIETGRPILDGTPIWENIIATDTSLTAFNDDPELLFSDIMELPLAENITFDLPIAVVVDFYGGDKIEDEFYVVYTYNNTCNNENSLAHYSKFYPNSFYDVQAKIGGQIFEGVFPLNPNGGILGVDVNNDDDVFDDELCEAFPIQNWHIGISISFDYNLIAASSDTLCQGEMLTLRANPPVLGSQPYTYVWQTGDGVTISTEQQVEILPNKSDTYFLQITDAENNNFSAERTIVVNTLSLTMPDDVSVACGDTFEIAPTVNSSANNITYNWINGDTTTTITVLPGNYSLTVTDGYCSVTDSVIVSNDTNISADFEVSIEVDGEVKFLNSSSNATSYQWSFGDGNTSTEESPVHTYAEPGIYTVSLNALDGDCSISQYKEITVNNFMVNVNYNQLTDVVTISPNPSITGQFLVSLHSTQKSKIIDYTVFDISGKILFDKQMINQQNQFEIDLKNQPSSTYFLLINDGQNKIIKKLLLLQ